MALQKVSIFSLAITTILSVSCTCIDVDITVSNTSSVANIDNKFVGVTFDAAFLTEAQQFGGLNLSSAKVQLLASALSPCYFRIGGTGQDNLTYIPSGKYDANYTITGASWDFINEFVQAVGWDFIFGLNALKRNGLRWDPTNALELLRYTAEKKYRLAGFELGNEPDIFPKMYHVTIPGTEIGSDFFEFKTLMRKMPEFNSTMVIGPDIATIEGPGETQFFSDFFIGGGSKAVDRITVHHYYANGKTANIDVFTDPEVMDQLIEYLETVQNVTRRTNPTTPLWLGETSSCYNGGLPGISNTYVAGFLWLDKLGIAAKMGVKAVLRQDFYGNHYPLLKTGTFDPLPDYWLTLMYKKLVGSPVLKVDSNSTYVRTYAHCIRKDNDYGYAPGSVVIYLLVISDDMVKVTFADFKNQAREVFWLDPVGNLTSQTVALNGLPLEFTENKFPQLVPVSLTEESLYFPGKTFGFLVFPQADFNICKN